MVESLDSAQPGRWRWAVAFFIVVYLVTALLWLPVLRSGRPVSALSGRSLLLVLLASAVPSTIGLVIATVEGGRAGAGALLRQVGRWRFGPGWYAFALLLMPGLAVLALVIALLVGGGAPVVRLDFLVPVAAIGEELGWRGYALPRLQAPLGALPASLVIGVVWAAWHLPYFTDPSMHPLPFGIDFGLFAVLLTAEGVLATWLYNSTRGSLLATMLFHHSIHLASVVPVIPGVAGTLVMALVDATAAGAAIVLSSGSLQGIRRKLSA